MSSRFVSIDRNQPLLLPPDLRDWIPEDDLVHFVIAAVEGMSLSVFKVNARGTGSAQYPPHMIRRGASNGPRTGTSLCAI